MQQFMLGLALLAGLLWNLAHAAEVNAVRVDAGATGTRAELRLDRDATFNVMYLANPDRLVLDLPGSAIKRGVSLPPAAGVVKSVRSGQPVPGTARIVFDLTAPVSALHPRLEQAPDGPRLVLEWPSDGPQHTVADSVKQVKQQPSLPTQPLAGSPIDTAGSTQLSSAQQLPPMPTQFPAISPPSGLAPQAQPANDPSLQGPMPIPSGSHAVSSAPMSPGEPSIAAPAPAPAVGSPPIKTMQDVMRRGGLRPLIIAIDAGHGGQDTGAIGATGAREKDITLQVARELARQVNATAGLKAYLTRDTDYFIPLAQRYQKSRAAKADLFVSIHADAFNNPSARGSSVFVLSQRGASSQAAKWLANQENSADLVGGVRLQDKDNTLASVLLDLSQSATMKASEDMANHVLDGLKALGKTHKSEVERANFVVLRSPDVPSMLVETAFITNPDEESRLRDPEHQRRLATAILNGVNRYFTRQPPPGTLYAARAEAVRVSTTGGSP